MPGAEKAQVCLGLSKKKLLGPKAGRCWQEPQRKITNEAAQKVTRKEPLGS